MFTSFRVAAFAVAGLTVATAASAASFPVNESFHFNGSYDPYTLAPPAGNSTWSKGTANNDPTPNTDRNGAQPGVTYFNNNSTSRIQMSNAFTDAAFIATPGDYEWEFSIRLDVTSTSRNNASTAYSGFGVRDEGGNGKSIVLAHTDSFSGAGGIGGLVFLTSGFNAILGDPIYTAGVDGDSLLDGVMRTYTLRKWDDNGTMKVSVLLDNVVLDTRNYADFNDDAFSTLGTGVWTGSNGSTSDWVVDYVHFGAPIPEPASLALLGIGGLMMLRRRHS